MTPQLVAINRNGYEQVAMTGDNLHELHIEVLQDESFRFVKGQMTPYIEVKLDSGHVLYEHMNECEPIEEERATEIRAKEEAARLQIDGDRAAGWGGRGPLVYTR